MRESGHVLWVVAPPSFEARMAYVPARGTKADTLPNSVPVKGFSSVTPGT